MTLLHSTLICASPMAKWGLFQGFYGDNAKFRQKYMALWRSG
jgi:hypothetical protein